MHPTIENNLPQIRELCEKHHVQRLYVFGSALREDFKPGESDVDFIVELSYSNPHEHRRRFFDLIYDLEEILNSEIDLIELAEIRNPYFLEVVHETKREIYNAA